MAKCVKLRRKKTQVCIGSLNRQIQLFQRSITPPLNALNDQVDYDEDFTLIATVWAMIETPQGKTIFDEISQEKVVTHLFYIRRIEGLTSENWITYNSNRYDILRVIDFEENGLYQKLFAAIRGSDAKNAAKA